LYEPIINMSKERKDARRKERNRKSYKQETVKITMENPSRQETAGNMYRKRKKKKKGMTKNTGERFRFFCSPTKTFFIFISGSGPREGEKKWVRKRLVTN